jgi:hypothetical protein
LPIRTVTCSRILGLDRIVAGAPAGERHERDDRLAGEVVGVRRDGGQRRESGGRRHMSMPPFTDHTWPVM